MAFSGYGLAKSYLVRDVRTDTRPGAFWRWVGGLFLSGSLAGVGSLLRRRVALSAARAICNTLITCIVAAVIAWFVPRVQPCR